MKRIVILATNDFATDQRVLKSAGVFSRNNFDVVLAGRIKRGVRKPSLPYPATLFRLFFQSSAFFYAEYNIRAFLFLVFAKYSHILANDTDTLPAAFLASKIRRKQLIFDAHELFPEVPELHQRRAIKSVWQTIENLIFPRLKYSVTVCDSIADYYASKYGIRMQVIRNIPENKKVVAPALHYANKSILLYQGALNKGRGLEWIIDAMPFLPHCMLVIIGSGDIESELKQRVASLGVTENVVFLGRIPATELYTYTVSAQLGLCLLENMGMSYYYALPNRIFDYLQAGVPVVATPFPEIKNIVQKYNTGILVDDYRPQQLASQIMDFLNSGFDTSHFARVASELSWDNEARKLEEVIKNIL